MRQIFNYLEETVWSCNDGLIMTCRYMAKTIFSCGTKRKVPSGKDIPILQAWSDSQLTQKHKIYFEAKVDYYYFIRLFYDGYKIIYFQAVSW